MMPKITPEREAELSRQVRDAVRELNSLLKQAGHEGLLAVLTPRTDTTADRERKFSYSYSHLDLALMKDILK